MIAEEVLNRWRDELAGRSAAEIVDWAATTFGDRVKFASSLGYEDQVLSQMIAKAHRPISIFTLDTGRLFPESYDLIQKMREQYGITLEIFSPEREDVETMVAAHGVNLFYDSIENRKLCCEMRKIRPLRRALTGLDAWMTGLRRAQSVTRTTLEAIEWDTVNGLVKINPLFDWSEEQTREYVAAENIPVNALHEKNFPSIGCAPCTRAVEPGEDVRGGRWWWESKESRECGLHTKDGKLVRIQQNESEGVNS